MVRDPGPRRSRGRRGDPADDAGPDWIRRLIDPPDPAAAERGDVAESSDPPAPAAPGPGAVDTDFWSASPRAGTAAVADPGAGPHRPPARADATADPAARGAGGSARPPAGPDPAVPTPGRRAARERRRVREAVDSPPVGAPTPGTPTPGAPTGTAASTVTGNWSAPVTPPAPARTSTEAAVGRGDGGPGAGDPRVPTRRPRRRDLRRPVEPPARPAVGPDPDPPGADRLDPGPPGPADSLRQPPVAAATVAARARHDPPGDGGAGPGDDPDAAPGRRLRRRGATWLTVAALLLAAWSGTVFLDSGAPLVAGPAALAPLVAVLALPVIAVGVASRHVLPTAIAVVAALVPWLLVTGYAAAGPGVHTVGTRSTLRVMSVDGAGGRTSARDIVQLTRIYGVDVVVVSGLTGRLAHDLTVAGLNALAPPQWVDVPATGGGSGTGLWARFRIEGLTPIDGLDGRGVEGAVDAGGDRVGITVASLRGGALRPGRGWRSDLAQLGARRPPGGEGLLVGDLDATPWHPAFRRLTRSHWRDAADVVGQGLRPTWPSWSPLPIVPDDHVLVTPGLGVSEADSRPVRGSTHRALIVTLVLPHAGG